MRFTVLNKALRETKAKDFEVDFRSVEDSLIRKDLLKYKNTILTEKNLLLFFPYKLYFMPEYGDCFDGLDEVLYMLNTDFANSLGYRKQKLPKYDTYFATIYEQYFLFMEFDDSSLIILDMVPLNESAIWEELRDYELGGVI